MYISKIRCTAPLRQLLVILCCLPLAVAAQRPADLTGLSLEELYDLDVVQINVLGAHTHPKGQTMFGYHYMFMNMEGIYKGDREISPAEAFNEGFTIAHTKMEMQMHMIEAMHAP